MGGDARCYGTPGEDLIGGTDARDIAYARDGEDHARAGIGNDTVHAGNDGYGSLEQGVRGARGNDRLLGGSGDDYLRGDLGDDRMNGGSEGGDGFFGGPGNDEIYASDGSPDDVLGCGGGPADRSPPTLATPSSPIARTTSPGRFPPPEPRGADRHHPRRASHAVIGRRAGGPQGEDCGEAPGHKAKNSRFVAAAPRTVSLVVHAPGVSSTSRHVVKGTGLPAG